MAKFKKGDRVKIVELGFVHQSLGIAAGSVGTVEEDGSMHPYVTFDGRDGLVAVAETRLELLLPAADATGKPSFTIETGKFYRTRDGRKVGPMEIWNPAVEHPWQQQGGSAVFSAGGDIWRDDCSSEYDVPQLTAEWSEWIDEPASNDNQPVAEQQAGTVFIDVSKAGPSQLHLAKGPLVRLNKGYYGYELARYGDYVWVEIGQKAPIVMRADAVMVAA